MNDMNIVYSCDNNFVDVLLVSMYSLLEKNKDISFWIIEKDIDEINKEKIKNICRNTNVKKIEFIHFDLSTLELKYKINLDRNSISAYYRIFIGNLLPKDIVRVIYIDCDTLILEDITELYTVDLEGKTIGAVTDMFFNEYKKALKIPIEYSMFNSGVLVIDLNKWRKYKKENVLLNKLKEFKGNPIQGDLGLLSSVFYNDYYMLDLKYNVMSSFYDFSYKELKKLKAVDYYYTEEEITIAKEQKVIRHFTTSFLSERPWIEGKSVDDRKIWNNYMQKLGINLKKGRFILIKEIVRFLCETKCRFLIIFLIGKFQKKIRPILQKLRIMS